MLQFQWPPPDVTPGGPQVNKFEQVSSEHHQMSLARGPQMNKFEQVSNDHHQMSQEGLLVWCQGSTLPDLQYDLSHDAFNVTYPSPLWTERRLWKRICGP